MKAVRIGCLLAALLAVGCPGKLRPVAVPGALSDQSIQERIIPTAATAPATEPPDQLPAPQSLQTDDAAQNASSAAPMQACFALEQAIKFGLDNNPRLRVAQEQVAAARAGQDIAFAPFLPQFDAGARYSAFNIRSLPTAGFVAGVYEGGEYAFVFEEMGVYWTICDFGRTAGRYGQAVTKKEIAELHLLRARQTIAFEVASSAFRLLLAHAALRVREQALRQSEAILKDTRARLEGGTVERNAVLRAEVEVSESREALVSAREYVFDAQARLNVAMGRSVSLPIEVKEIADEPPFVQSLEECLQQAIAQRREIEMARRVVAGALYGEQAARGELLPKVFLRGSVGRIDSGGSLRGWLEGVGIHFEQSLYGGGKRIGEVRRNEAVVRASVAQGQVILDNIALEVNLAYRNIASSRERIRLGESATTQARENLRLTRVRYDNSDATPTDIVDAQTALTRASMRYYSAVFDYLLALSQLDYAIGGDQARFLEQKP